MQICSDLPYSSTMPDDDPQSVIDQLKRWCTERYGRQAAVAREFGVSRQLVNDWLSGKVKPTWETGVRLKAFLKSKQPKATK